MEEKSDGEKMDEVMLPGFRFHPTDEELVGFYLKRKVQQRSLSIELIKQLDIYKYDPWDLPRFAMTGEKEWYFYCPRDRKYRNSARPNRVTGAGFWKATGTDRPIYSSEGNKCIGLKKSLVFYKGRAAKGVKTDWMMHEFRLPSLAEASPKRFMDKSIPANDSWAICRIFKKTNTTAQRALSHSFVSSVPETNNNASNVVLPNKDYSTTTHFNSDRNMPPTAKASPYMHFSHESVNNQQPSTSTTSTTSTITPFSCLDFAPYKSIDVNPITNHQLPISCGDHQDLRSFLFAPLDTSLLPQKCTVNDVSSLLLNMTSNSFFGDYVNHVESLSSNLDFSNVLSQEQCPALVSFPQDFPPGNIIKEDGDNCYTAMKNVDSDQDQYWETVRSVGFPFGLPGSGAGDHHHQGDLKQNLLPEYSSTFGSEMPACCSVTKCFT